MRYLLAILLPPLAVLACGKIFQFFFSIILTLLFWVPGIIHALFVVNSHLADIRAQKVVRAIKQQNKQAA